MSIRLTYRENGTRVTRWGLWSSTWDALDWAHKLGLAGASARKVDRNNGASA